MSRKFSRKELLSIGFLIGLVVVVFWRAVFLRGIFWFYDIENFFYPGKVFYAWQLKQGSIPLWASHLGFGFPLHAEGQLGFFYPLNLILFFLLPSSAALNCSILCHVFLAGLFAFLYARVIGLGRVPSILCGVVFMLSGFFMGHLIHFSMLCAGVWLPLIFLFIELYFKKRNFLYIALAGAIVGFQLLGGHPQISLYSLLGSSLYFTYRAFLDLRVGRTRGEILRLPLNLVLIILIGAGLASIQLLPTYELARLSVRGGGVSASFAERFAFPVQNFITFVFPFFFGRWGSYWGASTFWETSCYLGIMPLALVLAALMGRRDEHVHFFTGLLLFSLLLALGRLTPFYRILRLLPGFNYFSAPGRFLYLSAFSVAVLAAIGLEHLADEKSKCGKGVTKRVLKVFFPLGFLIGLLAMLARSILVSWRDYFISLGQYYIRHFVHGRSYHTRALPYYYDKLEKMYSGLIKTVSLSNPHILLPLVLLLLTLCWLGLWQWEKLSARVFKGGVLGFVVLDLVFFASMASAPLLTEPSRVLAVPPYIRFLKGAEQGYRKLTIPNYDPSNIGLIYCQSSADLYSPIPTRRYGSFMGALMGFQNPLIGDDLELRPEFAKVAGFSNIKYVLSPFNLKNAKLRVIYDGEINIYENEEVLPRAYVVSKAELIGDEDELLRALKSSEFNPRSYVLLEEKPRVEDSKAVALSNRWQAKIVNYSNGEVLIKVNSENDGFLVLSDAFYPGWKAFIDGKEAKIYRANYLFRAVELGKGQHVVKFKFDSASYKIGLVVTLVTLGLLGTLMACLYGERFIGEG